MFDHLSVPRARVNVKDFGAIGDGATNDTAAIVAAADSLAEGGVVYVPSGIYMIDFIPFREGVIYLLEGKAEAPEKGYTDELREQINSGSFAVLRSTGKGDMFINHEKGQFATDHAVSNYGLSGGVIDCVGKVRAFIFIHCHNVLLENCIILDSPNNHSIQVTGAEDVMIRNCMFVGYNFCGNLYSETIQIEQSHPGAIGWQMFTSSNMSYGEYRFCKNVTVDSCYFGKSDKYGAPLVPIGHHGHGYKSGVTGCRITNCVFDNPLYMALRPEAYSELVIENNTFISTEPRVIDKADAMITYVLGKPTDKGIALDDEGHYLHATYEVPYAAEGSLGSVIRNNKFIIKGDRIPRVISAVGMFRQGMQVTTHLLKIDEFKGKAYIFHGYRTVKNMIADLEFCNNEIIVLDRRPRVNDHLMYFEKVNGLSVHDNKLTSAIDSYHHWYRENEAVKVYDCAVGSDANTRYIEGDKAAGRRVILQLNNGESANIHCAERLTITLYTEKEGSISTSTDDYGNGIVSISASRGYRFIGWENADTSEKLGFGDIELENDLRLIAIYEKIK